MKRHPRLAPVRSLLRAAFAVLVLTGPWPLAHAAPSGPDIKASEEELKAAYIYNFTKFITWPASAWKSPADPFVICVGEDKALYESLKAAQGLETNGRPIEVRLAGSPGELGSCAVLYVPGSARDRWRTEAVVRGAQPMLVISDGPADGFPAGVVFTTAGSKLVFDINLRLAQACGISFSSKLLKLAREVQQ